MGHLFIYFYTLIYYNQNFINIYNKKSIKIILDNFNTTEF